MRKILTVAALFVATTVNAQTPLLTVVPAALSASQVASNIVKSFEPAPVTVTASGTGDTCPKALAKNVSSDDENSKQRAANIATEITEKISVQSDGILKGVYVTERKLSSDKRYVVVTVQVDQRSMKAARQVRLAMQ